MASNYSLKPVILNILPDTNVRVVGRDVTYTSDRLSRKFIVPKGFRTNGASIPKSLRWAVGEPYNSKFIAAAVIHDYLYRKAGTHGVSRKTADLVFREILKRDGVGKIKRYTMYYAVRTFGGPVWKKYLEKNT